MNVLVDFPQEIHRALKKEIGLKILTDSMKEIPSSSIQIQIQKELRFLFVFVFSLLRALSVFSTSLADS